MPTLITHGFVSIAFGNASNAQKNWLLWVLAILCSIIPDADVVAFELGIPYNNTFGHRGFSHSIFFAVFFSLIVVLIFYRKLPRFSKSWWSMSGLFFVIILSHPLLDAMTDGGLGVAFFSPFSNHRYFFDFRPIEVAPISISRFFNGGGYKVILSEAIWVWIPCFMLSIIYAGARRCLIKFRESGENMTGRRIQEK